MMGTLGGFPNPPARRDRWRVHSTRSGAHLRGCLAGVAWRALLGGGEGLQLRLCGGDPAFLRGVLLHRHVGLVRLPRLGVSPQLLQGTAEAVIRVGIGGTELDVAFVGVHRLLEATLGPQREREVVPGERVGGGPVTAARRTSIASSSRRILSSSSPSATRGRMFFGSAAMDCRNFAIASSM